jgi:hypothetical protein
MVSSWSKSNFDAMIFQELMPLRSMSRRAWHAVRRTRHENHGAGNLPRWSRKPIVLLERTVNHEWHDYGNDGHEDRTPAAQNGSFGHDCGFPAIAPGIIIVGCVATAGRRLLRAANSLEATRP